MYVYCKQEIVLTKFIKTSRERRFVNVIYALFSELY